MTRLRPVTPGPETLTDWGRTGYHQRVRVWPWIAAASGGAVAGVAAVWWLAAPRGSGVCPAILPAPPGCAAAARVPVAVTWTLVVAAVYGVNLVVCLTRLRRHQRLLVGVLLAQVVAVVAGYRSVLFP